MTKRIRSLPSGEEIAYWEENPGKKPTIILVHGFTGSHEGFQYVIPLLDTFHTIALDLPGFGESPLPHEKLTLAEIGKLLIDFTVALKLPEKPILLGHSMGSLVVVEAIRQQPSLFAHKLILASPVPQPVEWLEMRRLGVLFSRLYYVAGHRLPAVGVKIAKSKMLSRVGTNAIMTTSDKTLKETIHNHHYKNLDFISSIGWNRRLHGEINRTGLSRYKTVLKQFDILLVNGDHDNVTPLKMQKKIARDIGAKLEIIHGTGHLSHYEMPEALAGAIRGFLR